MQSEQICRETGQRFCLALSLYELHLLKHKFGLSMQAWIYRARDLGIISLAKGESPLTFGSKGWHKQKPVGVIAPEIPRRFERLVMGTLADCLISESRAEELLGMPVRDFLSKEGCMGDGWLRYVTDANLWIYLLHAEIESRVFRLPWEFVAPDVVLAEILRW